jgi:hypothetical protein
MNDNKPNVLVKIANRLNANKITWVLGSSMMLYLRSVIESFNDIDIIVHEDDILKTKEVLDKLGILLPRDKNARYATKHFLEYEIDGVEVDIMSGFTIISKNEKHYFTLDKSKNYQSIILGGETIYLDNWLKYYQLMERLDKVEIINSFLHSKE